MSLSRDIQWVRQKQKDRKKLKQANQLLHEKISELKVGSDPLVIHAASPPLCSVTMALAE